ncbi:MAG: hypothetical protein K5694_02375 [Bacilli bacterium]|nr:hypothetical protein [Bacilli bacterium]
MKIRPNKRDIRDFFVSWGWLIVLLIGISVFAWAYSISLINQIKDFERINFFIESYGLKEHSFEADLRKKLEPDGVLEVNLYDYQPNDRNIGDYYDAFGTISDFIVVNDKDLSDMSKDYKTTKIMNNYLPFTSTIKDEVIMDSSFAYYAVGEADYALKIYDKDDKTYNSAYHFDDLITFEKEGQTAYSWYLMLNAKTVNFGKYNTNSKTSNAVTALSYFLEVFA